MGHQRGCLARYGRTSRLEWLDFVPELADSLERGRAVVIRSRRGEELGEVLMMSDGRPPGSDEEFDPDRDPEADASRSRVIRIAEDYDHERARIAEETRQGRFDECLHLLEDGRWPVELIDVELLLDGRTTVVDLFKSDDFDLTALRSQFRDWFDFDVILEPAGGDNEAAIIIPAEPKPSSSGGCGSGGCGSSGGGCGSGGCGSGGCGS